MSRLIVAVFALAGCAPWTVIQRAEPNPLEGQKFVAALPLDWSEVMVLDEISIELKETGGKREWGLFRRRLARAAHTAGADVAEYFVGRAR